MQLWSVTPNAAPTKRLVRHVWVVSSQRWTLVEVDSLVASQSGSAVTLVTARLKNKPLHARVLDIWRMNNLHRANSARMLRNTMADPEAELSREVARIVASPYPPSLAVSIPSPS